MHIGIIQTGHAPSALIDRFGDYPAIFEELLAGNGFTFSTWAAVDGVLPPGPDAAEGWLVTGSRHGTYDDLPWIAPLEEFLRAAVASGRPMVGICFGHQIIAQALGGRVAKDAGGFIIGPQTYDIEGEKLTLNAWHQDQIVELPPGARVLGSGPGCPYAVLAHGENVLTWQAHPEFDHDFIEGLIVSRGQGLVPEERLQAARAAAGMPLDRAAVARRMADFLRAGRLADTAPGPRAATGRSAR